MCGLTKDWLAQSQVIDAFEVWQGLIMTIFDSTENHHPHLKQYGDDIYFFKICKNLPCVERPLESFSSPSNPHLI